MCFLAEVKYFKSGVGLSVSDRSSLMSPQYQSPTAYDRLQSFRAPPMRQYVPHPSGYVNQYFIPEQPPDRLGSVNGLYSRGKMYDGGTHMPQQAMMRPPDLMMRPQPAYVMRPHVMQQPHQLMMRYPAQATWEQQHDALSPVNAGIAPFSRQYSGSMQSGIAPSPSGPVPAAYPSSPYTSFVPDRSLPDMFEGEKSFDFVGQSATPTPKTN